MGDFLVGDHVDVNGRHAIVRFVGTTEFQEGEWVGVEMDMPTGKNNGTVQGVQYFECRDRYGMFVRPFVPRLIDRPVAAPPRRPRPAIQAPRPESRNTPAAGSRPDSRAASATPGITATQKRLSVSSSPVPTAQKGRSMTLRVCISNKEDNGERMNADEGDTTRARLAPPP
jgi:dynactin 1